MPVVDELWPVISEALVGKGPDDLLFTNSKGRIWGGWNWKSRVQWEAHSRGRRVHDLRHTAATLWLSSGIPPKTVQAWLGHSTAAMTMDRYAHYLPMSEGAYGLALMNEKLATGGTRGARKAEQHAWRQPFQRSDLQRHR